jgi:hypothetical protein
VVIGTDEFEPLARAEAAARGLAGLPIVTVPHPIGGLPQEAVTGKAARIVDAARSALTRSAVLIAPDESGPVGGPGPAASASAAARHVAPDEPRCEREDSS